MEMENVNSEDTRDTRNEENSREENAVSRRQWTKTRGANGAFVLSFIAGVVGLAVHRQVQSIEGFRAGELARCARSLKPSGAVRSTGEGDR